MSDYEDNQFPVVSVGVIGEATVQTVNARDLHAFLEVGKDFSTWMKDRIAQYGFAEGEDYCVLSADLIAPQNGGAKRGGHNRAEYHISLDMGKELGMVERNEKGKEVRQYFIRMEKQARQAPMMIDLDDPAQLRPLLANYAERVQAAEAKVIQFQPKAEAFDRLEASEGAVIPRVAAKMLDVTERKFFRWMEVNSWFFRQGGKGPWLGYAERRKQGYIEHAPKTFIDANGDERTTVQVKITPKGLARLAQIFSQGGEAA